MNFANLADASQSLAVDLDNEQAAENYEGSQAITLGKLSVNLSTLASTLRTLDVGNEIANSTKAINALTEGTQAANGAVTKLKDADAAIQIAGLVISLGAAIISDNPGSVISACGSLITAAKSLQSAAG